MSRLFLADALKNEGLTVHTDPGWEERGTDEFAPQGVVLHHTAGQSTPENPFPSLEICKNGRPDLEGPLCQLLVGLDGSIHMIASGRANHAGPILPSGPLPDGDGNSMYLGIEIDYHPDYQEVGEAQRQTSMVATAVVLHEVGQQDAAYVRGHKEVCDPPGRKIDPSNFRGSMDDARASIQNELNQRGWGL